MTLNFYFLIIACFWAGISGVVRIEYHRFVVSSFVSRLENLGRNFKLDYKCFVLC